VALVLGAGSSAHATIPGPNGRIVFGSSRDGNAELYSVNADGGALRRLTWTPQTEQSPAWSPDGGRIAYESEPSGGRWRVWVMNADGSGQTQISPAGSDLVDDMDPAWSPDGTEIAFASTRAGTWNLWVMNADGSGLRQVSGVFADDPAWSPDGHRLAYVGSDGVGVVGVDGSNPHLVSAPGAFASGPSWSPDGSEIVFARNNAQGYPGELYIANADGSGERQLTSGGVENAGASWSPDGTQIVFQRTTAAPSGWSLWAIGVDGTGLRQVTSGGSDFGPDWGSSQVVPEPSPPDAPTIQIFSPADGAFYLPGAQVPAFYLCSSNVSFIVSCQGDLSVGALLDLSQAGTHTFTVHALDADGRTATQTVTYQVPDLIAPQIDLRTPKNGASYDLGAAVTIDYSCTDGPGGSGVAACSGTGPSGAPLDTSRAGSHTFTVLAVDNAGNLATATAAYTVVAPPQIQLTSPAEGATFTLGAAVLAAYSCLPASGVQLVSCAGTVANGDRLDTGSVGTKTFTVNATDSGGRTSTVSHTYTVVGPPQIQISSPTDGATYPLGAAALAVYTCSSTWNIPIVSCAGTVANGSPLDTGSVGTKTITVNATDALGGTATSARTYTVVYAFSGFDPPVSTTGSITDAKAGDGLPLKFSLHGNQGTNIVTRTSWQPASCTNWSTLGTTNPGQGQLSYNPTTDRYLDLVTTDPTWKGTCRTLDLQLADGTHHTIHITFTH
jgi:hypothetical protein